MASLASDGLAQHLSKQSRTGPATVTGVGRKPSDGQKGLPCHDRSVVNAGTQASRARSGWASTGVPTT